MSKDGGGTSAMFIVAKNCCNTKQCVLVHGHDESTNPGSTLALDVLVRLLRQIL